MNFEEAKRIGIGCGLETPEEWIRNIFAHSTMLFIWTEMNKELAELIEDAKKHGVDIEKMKKDAKEQRKKLGL